MPIVKILSRKTASYRQLINYILNPKDRVKDSFILTQNLREKGTDGWVKEFEMNESFREYERSGNNKLTHEIISFSPEESKLLTSEILEDIAAQFISLRGDSSVVVSAPHFNKDHPHLHFCFSALEYRTGMSMRISKKSFHDLKIQLENQIQEKYPFLTKSVVEHGKGTHQISDREYQVKKRTQEPSKRGLIKNKLDTIFNSVASMDELQSKLKASGMNTYLRGGKVYGIEADHKRYRFSTMGFFEKFQQLEQNLPLPKSIEEDRQLEIKRLARLKIERDLELVKQEKENARKLEEEALKQKCLEEERLVEFDHLRRKAGERGIDLENEIQENYQEFRHYRE
jgi:MobA/VirD2-like, nuclease domain